MRLWMILFVSAMGLMGGRSDLTATPMGFRNANISPYEHSLIKQALLALLALWFIIFGSFYFERTDMKCFRSQRLGNDGAPCPEARLSSLHRRRRRPLRRTPDLL